MKSSSSFTLIELVIVIGILAVLAAVVVIVINPAEYMKSARDSQRVSELQTITKAIGLYLGDGKTSIGSTNIVYVSIPDSSATCANLGLPALPGGWSYQCSTSANYRKADGTGWLPINFSSVSFTNPLQTLPVDPVNTTSTGNYYAYVNGGSFELAASMESSKYKLGGTNDKASKDGGAYPELYETGSNLTLLPVNYGDTSLVGYWKFDEGSGTTAYDASGHGNNGTLTCSGVGCLNPAYTTGKVGIGALSFSTSTSGGNAVLITQNSAFAGPTINAITFSMWINPLGDSSWKPRLIEKGYNASYALTFCNTCIPDKFGFALVTNTNSINLDCANLTRNTWQHIVAEWESGTRQWKCFYNGSLSQSGNLNGSYVAGGSSPNLYIGNPSSNTFFGNIDDVRIYNKALTAAEISALYNATNK